MVKIQLALAAACFAASLPWAGEARAQDTLASFFQPLTQLWSDEPEDTIAYEARIILPQEDSDLKDALEDASPLIAQSDKGAPSLETLLAQAREEQTALTAALYGEGHYSGKITVEVAGQEIDEETSEIEAPEERPIPVVINVDPGARFTFGSVGISYSGETNIRAEDEAIAEDNGLTPGKPARSTAIIKTGDRLIAAWKQRGHAFAKIASRDVTADHASHTVDVSLNVDRGKAVHFGEVSIKGAERFDEDLLRSRAAIPTGSLYSPEALKASRKRLVKLDGVRGVRIVEGEEPDPDGRIPIVIDVSERKLRYFGANASVSSVDGAELGAYWGHRNVFGGGESLRVEGSVSNLGAQAEGGIEYEAKVSLTRPSIANPYTDYNAFVLLKHEEPDSYESDQATISAGATHRFTPETTGNIAGQASWIETTDSDGAHEFFLLSVPAELVHDARDNTLDPSRGWRASLFAEPAADIINSTAHIRSRAQISAYKQLGTSPRVVAAGKVGVGVIAGGGRDDIPAPSRFLAGGGGSVRGYAFRSVGPEIGGEITGGLSIVELSGELRIKLNETFGIVPFVDAAFVTGDGFFAGESETAVGAGIGLRYHTAIGPIRLDVATPLDRLNDDPEVVVYVGLGQAF